MIKIKEFLVVLHWQQRTKSFFRVYLNPKILKNTKEIQQILFSDRSGNLNS